MLWLVCVGMLASVQGTGSYDVSKITVGAPATVAALDTGTLNGEIDQLSWGPDGTQFYLEVVEGKGKVSHYVVTAADGKVTKADAAPAWATEYWKFKQDRYAPGIESLVIDVKQSYETVHYGTGSAGGADRTSGGGAVGENQHGASADNVTKAAVGQKQSIVKLVLLNETIGTWVDKRPTPGTTFGWGPSGSGAMAFVDEKGELELLDSHSHKQKVAGTKEVSLPAWSMDGSRLAWLAKSGRNKYMLVWSTLDRR